jgi:hypothetical protein
MNSMNVMETNATDAWILEGYKSRFPSPVFRV